MTFVIPPVPQPTVEVTGTDARFPVHRIRKDYQPTEAPDTPTFLLVHRDAEDTVRFIELNPVSARLIGLLAEHADDPGYSGRLALDSIARELQHAQPDLVIAHGLELGSLNDNILLLSHRMRQMVEQHRAAVADHMVHTTGLEHLVHRIADAAVVAARHGLGAILVGHDPGPHALQARGMARVVEMGMGADNMFHLEIKFFYELEYSVRLVSRIDNHTFFCLFISNDKTVALKRSDN